MKTIHFKAKISKIFIQIKSFVSFFVLVYSFLLLQTLIALASVLPVTKKVLTFFQQGVQKFTNKIDVVAAQSPKRIDLIQLAFFNMKAKKTRTIITIGGMTLGVAVIVFLISIGYGLQSLVINRIARLEELQQIEVTTAPGSKLKLTDETLATISGIETVSQVLPFYTVVAKVNYNNSASDMAVFGVTSEYLQQSAIKPVTGTVFDSNQITLSSTKSTTSQPAQDEKTAVIAELGDPIASVRFTIGPDTWLVVRDQASKNGKVLGYINNQIGEIKAEQLWGEEYLDDAGNGSQGKTSNNTPLGIWLQVKVPLWKQITPTEYEQLTDTDGNQMYVDGYVAKIDVTITEFNNAIVGDTITVSNPNVSDLDSQIPELAAVEKVTVASGEHEAIVNRAFLNVLQLSDSEAIGKTFETTFTVTGKLLSSEQQKIESEPVTYTIIGITPDSKTPSFFVPFVDIRSLGIQNFSQIKVVTDSKNSVPEVRKKIEALGFQTNSISDTISQIDSLFSTVRFVMGIVGSVALSIATLGMFNTLTVSLIERTREVGLLKAMGAQSFEIKDLLYAESILMGSLGGILGLLVGYGIGKLLELMLSLFTLSQGIGTITIVDIPFSFISLIIVLSFLVGVFTGVYPAHRATKISALDALRYE